MTEPRNPATPAQAEREPETSIHPTAILSREVHVAEGVRIGPQVVIEGKVTIGPDTIIKPHVHICGDVTLGRGNHIFSGAVLGEQPQHLRYAGEPTRLVIGDNNIFRENVTIHRGTTHSGQTRIGSNNLFMAGAHVAHDCVVGDHCLLANNALVGGHCLLEDNVFLSGNSAVHQFVRVGRLAFLSGCSATTKDIVPFTIQQDIDSVKGVNLVGLRRAGMPAAEINAVRQAFRILFRSRLTLPAALETLEAEYANSDAVREMISFLQECPKGINPMRRRPAA